MKVNLVPFDESLPPIQAFLIPADAVRADAHVRRRNVACVHRLDFALQMVDSSGYTSDGATKGPHASPRIARYDL